MRHPHPGQLVGFRMLLLRPGLLGRDGLCPLHRERGMLRRLLQLCRKSVFDKMVSTRGAVLATNSREESTALTRDTHFPNQQRGVSILRRRHRPGRGQGLHAHHLRHPGLRVYSQRDLGGRPNRDLHFSGEIPDRADTHGTGVDDQPGARGRRSRDQRERKRRQLQPQRGWPGHGTAARAACGRSGCGWGCRCPADASVLMGKTAGDGRSGSNASPPSLVFCRDSKHMINLVPGSTGTYPHAYRYLASTWQRDS